MTMLRVAIAGLLLVGGSLLGGLAHDIGQLAVYALGLGLMFLVSLALPHYFYRGEPLLPDRRKRH